MFQEVFRIPIGEHGIPIYGFGLMLVIGFILLSQLAKYLAKRCGIDGELFINAALIGLFTGVLGARISHVLENLGDFTRGDRGFFGNLAEVFNFQSGGLTYYGGFLLAFPTLVLYGLWKKIPIRLGMDIVAPCLMIGLGVGRIGCLLNGCCYGAQCPSDAFYSIRFPYYSNAYLDEYHNKTLEPANMPGPKLLSDKGYPISPSEAKRKMEDVSKLKSNALHPAQVYSTITALLLSGLCLAFFTIRKTPGMVFAMMMVLEGITRYILELLRSEPAVWGKMSLSMVLGILLVIGGLLLGAIFMKMGPMGEPKAA